MLTKSTYSKTNLKDSQIAVAEEFADHAKTLLQALGIKLIDIAPKAEINTEYLYCKGKTAFATGFKSNNGFTVLKDSIINIETAPSFKNKAYYKLRQQLIDQKIIVDLKFVKDYEFQAPSGASSVVLGRASNGKIEWKTKTGKNLSELNNWTLDWGMIPSHFLMRSFILLICLLGTKWLKRKRRKE